MNDPFGFKENLKDTLIYNLNILITNKKFPNKKLLVKSFVFERKVLFEKVINFKNWSRNEILNNLKNNKIYSPKFENLSLNFQKEFKDYIVNELFSIEIIKEIEYLIVYYESIRYYDWLNNLIKKNINIYDEEIEKNPYISLN